MTGFKTDLVIPSKTESASGFFKVVGPTFTLVLFAAFIRSNYLMNMTDPPFFLTWPLILLVACIALSLTMVWYHKSYTAKGDLAIDEDNIHYSWKEPKEDKSFPINEVSNLKLVYDGYADFWSTAKGIDNVISFNHNGNSYSFNFRLNNEEAASDMAKVVKAWYDKGITIEEEDTAGDERYLMIYSSEYRQSLA